MAATAEAEAAAAAAAAAAALDTMSFLSPHTSSSSSSSSSSNSNSFSSPDQKRIKYIPLSYNPHNSHRSATHLILTLFPEWNAKDVKLIRFTDGITNTLLKCVNAALNEDEDAVLLRAYGRETGILIDRERECSNHALLSTYGLAPPLLARFNNGLLYRYVAGKVCNVKDLSTPSIYHAIASRLGQWHKVLPVDQSPVRSSINWANMSSETLANLSNLWGVLQKWITAVPNPDRRSQLQTELALLISDKENGGFGIRGQDGGVGLVFGHCDLLSGNVIILPKGRKESHDDFGRQVNGTEATKVHFIDYEYATPCERAFDIANHFAEWIGFECDYNLIPTRSARRNFIRTYLQSYNMHDSCTEPKEVLDKDVEKLMAEVDIFRGVPGFYWGIWALIQAEISQIDFDYAAYAELRLGEYWAWKEEFLGRRTGDKEMCLREKRWAMEGV